MYKSVTTNLMVESVDDSVAFYKDILGFTVVASVPNDQGTLQFAILNKDGLSLMLQERTNFIDEYPILATEMVHPSASLYIKVDDFDKTYLEIKEKHPILLDVHTTFYGVREFAIADHNGYVLTFTEHTEK